MGSRTFRPALVLLLPALAVLAPSPAVPQPPHPPRTALLQQEKERGPVSSMNSAELAALGDPLFSLVLREHADATSLPDLEALLRPASGSDNRRLFVVDESITDAAIAAHTSRRVVIAFTGIKEGQRLENVMLSVRLRPDDFADQQEIEAWGWDERRGRYNYYKLDRQGTPDRMTWKFRASSDGADLLTPEERRDTCLQCHTNGAPVMKELTQPWSNWHSQEFAADYLTPLGPADRRWQVAAHPRLASLREAQDLERSFLLGAIGRFNARRINDSLRRSVFDGSVEVNSQGFARALEGPRLLRPLFATTEVNLVSSTQTSGLHRFTRTTGGAADAELIEIPNDLFLNAALIGGNPEASSQGLGIRAAHDFRRSARLPRSVYQRIVTDSGVLLGGQPGDAHFAWFVPGPSHVDTDMAVQLLRRGVVPLRFLAALAAVDLETPIFSEARASLLSFVPDTFRFRPLLQGADPLDPASQPVPGAEPADALVPQVIASLRASQPAPGTPAALFLERLESTDPAALLRQDVDTYLARIRQAFAAPDTLEAEARRLQQVAISRRLQFLESVAFMELDETMGNLLPVPEEAPPP